MKKKLLFLLLSLIMTGSAFARCLFYIDDFTVMPEQLGTEIELCIKAEFSARVSSWILDLTYPEGITPVDAYLGADGYITYLNASGNTRTCTPTFIHNNDYTRFMAIVTDVGYWYDLDDELTSYGVVKWEGGNYEEMIILRVEVSADFQGGKIIMNTSCGSGSDTRGGTVRDNGDQDDTFTCECNVSVNSTEAYACYTPSNTTLTFYYDNLRNTRTGKTYDLNEGNDVPEWYTDLRDEEEASPVTNVVFDPSFADARPTSTFKWFIAMVDLESITGIAYLNTSEVTNMQGMFCYCFSLTSLDVSHFNTANVTDMTGMFYGCTCVTSLNLSSFNTTNVSSMNAMFAYCYDLTSLDLSHFNTANVTDMAGLFYECDGLTSLNLSSFNTTNVTDMGCMFEGCSGLTSLNLSSFNTTNVIMMYGMFEFCSNLTTIYVGDGWSTVNVYDSEDMFRNCYSIRGGAGTTYDEDHVDAAYAYIDGGPSNPGYLSEAPAFLRGDVNSDSKVNIADVTALIDILLSGSTPPASADCNGDSMINIADVTALIDYLLSGSWN